jgi:multiple sugar transport system ATP-binding protein
VFVAGFIGSPAMNLFPSQASNNAVTIGDSETISVETDREGAVTVGIRPEDLLLERGEARGTFKARVTLIEPMGADTLIFCLAGDNQELSIRVPRYVRVSDGETVALRPRDGAVHLFDPETGRRLN